MKAIETVVKTDTEGILNLNYSSNMKNTDVKVILMFPEKDDEEEKLWMKAISSNPAFHFLNEEPEIYTANDGQPVQHEK